MPTKSRTICTSGLGDASESGACRARFVGVWHAVALSEVTSLRHRETGSYVFSEIWYGGSWGRMRNAQKFQANRSGLGGDRAFRKKCQSLEIAGNFPFQMAVDVVV